MKVGKGGDLKKRALGVSAEGGSTGQRDANVDWQQSRSGGSFNKRSLSLSVDVRHQTRHGRRNPLSTRQTLRCRRRGALEALLTWAPLHRQFGAGVAATEPKVGTHGHLTEVDIF